MATIINKTPHPVNIVDENGKNVITYPKDGDMIRLTVKTVSQEPIGEVPTSITKFGEPEGLPPFKADTYYIVSQLVKSALPDRIDLLVPAEVMRDDNGAIIGCQSLGR